MADLIGQQIGSYRLIRLIGKGRISSVYLAEHLYLGSAVAIKVLPDLPKTGFDAFRGEASTIIRLAHPHIIRILDFGVIDRTPYIVMDYASNGSLSDRHPHGSQLPLATVLEYVKPIAEALQYMHNERLLHLDVKPGHMFIGRDNQIMLSEPDIAFVSLSLRTQTLSEEISGTPLYMAPEQIRGQPMTATDQYALGVTVYEWLSGRSPFEGRAFELFAQHISTPPPSLRMQVPLVSSAVEAVVLRALAKQPEDRFSSVSDFARALEQAVLSDKSYVSSSSTPVLTEPMTSELSPYITSSESSVPTPYPNYSSASTSSAYLSYSQEIPAPTKMRGAKSHVSRRALITSGLVGLVGLVGAEVFASSWGKSQNVSVTPTPNASALGSTVFVYLGHAGAVLSVAWSPNSNLIASSGEDDKVQLWNGLTGAVSFVSSDSTFPDAVVWSPDGTRIASGSTGGDMRVWSVNNGGSLLSVYTGLDSVNSVAWSPDGIKLASASQDKTVQVWDASDGALLLTYRGHSDVVTSVAWSPDGRYIASASQDKTVQVWDVSNGVHLFTYSGYANFVNSVAWSSDSRRIASGSNSTVRVWDASDGSLLFTYSGHTNFVKSVAWSPDSKRIASGSADRTVQVWDASSGSPVLTYTGHVDSVNSVAWSPGSNYIASGGGDKVVRVWRAG